MGLRFPITLVQEGYTVVYTQFLREEYQLQPFRGGDRILSMTFPELAVTTADIFEAVGL